MAINGTVLASIPKLKANLNYYAWVDSLRTALQGESYEMWDMATGQFKTSIDLVEVSCPSHEQARLDATEYYGEEVVSPALVRQYLEERVHEPNRSVTNETRRIKQLKHLTTFYIRASVNNTTLRVIEHEFDPFRCLFLLSQRFSGLPWDKALEYYQN